MKNPFLNKNFSRRRKGRPAFTQPRKDHLPFNSHQPHNVPPSYNQPFRYMPQQNQIPPFNYNPSFGNSPFLNFYFSHNNHPNLNVNSSYNNNPHFNYKSPDNIYPNLTKNYNRKPFNAFRPLSKHHLSQHNLPRNIPTDTFNPACNQPQCNYPLPNTHHPIFNVNPILNHNLPCSCMPHLNHISHFQNAPPGNPFSTSKQNPLFKNNLPNKPTPLCQQHSSFSSPCFKRDVCGPIMRCVRIYYLTFYLFINYLFLNQRCMLLSIKQST